MSEPMPDASPQPRFPFAAPAGPGRDGHGFTVRIGPRFIPPTAGQAALPAVPGQPHPDRPHPGRPRLDSLDPHYHCSIIGTCLPTAELRRTMARFIDVTGASDLEIHHEAVRLTSASADVAHAIGKTLDRRHDGAVRRFARAKAGDELAALWDQALQSGDIPGAYWALLSHRRATPSLQRKAFGDVHMLSHLVGAANRADIRRLVALEAENADLRLRLERQQARADELLAERDRAIDEAQRLTQRVQARTQALHEAGDAAPAMAQAAEQTAARLADAVAVQTRRREAAELHARMLEAENTRLANELEHATGMAAEIGHELAAAESALQWLSSGKAAGAAAEPAAPESAPLLTGRRLLYVGGRPSTRQAIRAVVRRQDGEYRHHDGGLEDRKGLLASDIAWADLVVFPVDCIDHDSATRLKRACLRQDKRFVPLRCASVTSFVAAMTAMSAGPPDIAAS